MSDIPNYSTYHLDELEKALSQIDESEKPEEAQVIREFIARGGYSYPSNPPIDSVIFASTTYKWSLTLILSILLAFNVYTLVMWNTVTSLIPITIQATLLYMIFKNHKHARMLIKIWCIVLLISAFFGFLSMYFAPEIITSKLRDNLFSLVVGLTYLVFADRSVRLVPTKPYKLVESDETFHRL